MMAAHTKKMIVLRLFSSLMRWTRVPARGGERRALRYVGGRAVGGEPYQRGFHIVKQTGPGARQHAAAGDEHIVHPRGGVFGQHGAGGLSHAALRAIAL